MVKNCTSTAAGIFLVILDQEDSYSLIVLKTIRSDNQWFSDLVDNWDLSIL